MTVYMGLIGPDNAVVPECAEEDAALGYNINFLLQKSLCWADHYPKLPNI
jgi:hypothetical protein